MLRLSRDRAEGFYVVHKERSFFNDLVTFMTSGPVMVQVLEGEDAIARNREIMGATNPQEAAEGSFTHPGIQSIAGRLAGQSRASREPLADGVYEVVFVWTGLAWCRNRWTGVLLPTKRPRKTSNVLSHHV